MSIYLRAFELDDYILINKWRTDPEIQSLTGGNMNFVSSHREKMWVEDKIKNNQQNIYLGICLSDNNELIGYLSINDIDWRNRKAWWGGLVVGEKEHRNFGYATDASRLMLQYIFNELGLNRFSGYWLTSNIPSIKVAEKLGFKKEGLLKESVYKNGKYHDLYLMTILQEEFFNHSSQKS